MTRRAYGALETDVLRALWTIDAPALPNVVIDEMGTSLAYTSIATMIIGATLALTMYQVHHSVMFAAGLMR